MAALGPAYHTPVAWGATAPPHSAARAFAVAPPVPAFLAPGVGGAATASLARCHRQELRYHRRPQAAAGAATAAWAEASLFPRARLGARALRALVMMSASDSGGGGGPGATEVPEATRKLLEQAAKARAEADEMEVAYRKEQGIENFAPSRASKAASPSATEVADPSNAAAQAAAAAALAAGTTPESRAALVEQLEDLPSESKRVIEKMESLKSEGLAPRWNSFNFGSRYPISQGQLKIQTGLDGKSLAADGVELDDLKNALGVVTVVSFICAIGFGAAIGGNVGASFTYFFALLPIIFLGLGSTSPGVIIAVIDNFKRKSKEDFEERRVRHEASHFLSGYLCGLPIKSYRAEGGTTLVEFYDSVDGDLDGRSLKFKPDEVDKVSIVAMAGAVGEAQAYGSATGGAADLDNLGQIMNQANPPMDGKAQQSQARWATLMAHRLLSSHDPELKALMEAFRAGKPVSECVAALEGARN
ncbi:unnamed protein product [Ascophyllum nodosum]